MSVPPRRMGHTFTDPRLAAAIVDRLTFRGHVINTGAQSCRLKSTQDQARSA
ncbi:DNA replication protein DnaC [Cryobacterium sp. CAN_C3]|nr:DNA replication protein DnaC [Cryobacterium sp. CAN_C3]